MIAFALGVVTLVLVWVSLRYWSDDDEWDELP